MIGKPKVFRLVDALVNGGVSLVVTVFAVMVQLNENPLAGKTIMWVTAAGFWFVYAMLLRWRWETFKSIDFVTKHGIYVIRRGHSPTQADIEALTEHVLERWEIESGWGGARESVKRLFLVWMPYPFTHHTRPKFKFTGLASGTGHAIAVGYQEPLTTSALGHELGHVIYGKWKGPHAEGEFRAFAVPHKLFY